MVVSVLDTATSIMAGMVIFSILGAKAQELGIPIEKVVSDGPGLAFVAYPEALLRLPLPQLWAVLFFAMLFILGLDSEVCLFLPFFHSLVGGKGEGRGFVGSSLIGVWVLPHQMSSFTAFHKF